ncbi:MAG: DNA polymerase III subunit beta [Acidobacteria bacterium]|nr:DNA polymerase III subunit beta [Acidobacteriota bacterium]
MKFTVTRNALLNELNLVQGVVEKKTTIPILSNILLEAAGEHIDIAATDLDVTIRCGCPAVVQAEGTTTISARRLFDIVRLLPESSDIEFSLLENDWVELRSGNSEYKIVALLKDNFPSIPEAAPATATIPGGLLRSMIQRSMFAITQEESRYSLNGALLALFPNEIRMVATDGHRLALVSKSMEVPGIDAEVRALIPRKTLVEILKLIGDQDVFIEFGRDENHLFFGVGGKRLVSRILAGQFPNYELVIPRDNDKLIIASTKALGDGIRRAAIMSDEKLRAIRLSFKTGALELTASCADAGEAREVVPIDYEGESLEIGFNPMYLLDFVGASGSESISISIKDSETQGLLRPVGTSELDYRYVVMPMKF